MATPIREGKGARKELKERVSGYIRQSLSKEAFVLIILGEMCQKSYGVKGGREIFLGYCDHHIERFTNNLMNDFINHNSTCPFHNAMGEAEREAVCRFVKILKSLKAELEGK